MNEYRSWGSMHTIKYYLTIKNEEILPFLSTWIDLEGIMLSERSQKMTNTVWSKKQTEKQNNQFTEKRCQICDYQRQDGGGRGIRGRLSKGLNFWL